MSSSLNARLRGRRWEQSVQYSETVFATFRGIMEVSGAVVRDQENVGSWILGKLERKQITYWVSSYLLYDYVICSLVSNFLPSFNELTVIGAWELDDCTRRMRELCHEPSTSQRKLGKTTSHSQAYCLFSCWYVSCTHIWRYANDTRTPKNATERVFRATPFPKTTADW